MNKEDFGSENGSQQPVNLGGAIPPQQTSSSAGIIILQWLTYAFWGWTLLAVVWLLYIVLASTIQGIDTTGMIPYAIAATLVLLPVSFICDWFYGKNEPQRKSGAAMVVMVIHAVIFALFAIGALISSVLIMVQLTIATPSESSGQTVWLTTFLISAFLYAITFVRTLNPAPKLKIHRVYPLLMVAVVGVLIVLGFVGPVAQASLTKDDRDIVRYLPGVSQSIATYVKQNEKLPDTLSDVTFNSDDRQFVDRGLVTYKKEDVSDKSKSPQNKDVPAEGYVYKYYRYQLCVNYKQASKTSSYGSYGSDSRNYTNDLYIYDYPAGEVCYKIEAPLEFMSAQTDDAAGTRLKDDVFYSGTDEAAI